MVLDGTATGFEDDSSTPSIARGYGSISPTRTCGVSPERVWAGTSCLCVHSSAGRIRTLAEKGPGLVGNERFLKAAQWESILQPLGAQVSTLAYADWKILTVVGVTLAVPESVTHHSCAERPSDS